MGPPQGGTELLQLNCIEVNDQSSDVCKVRVVKDGADRAGVRDGVSEEERDKKEWVNESGRYSRIWECCQN